MTRKALTLNIIHRDSTCATVITDDELINDDGGKMEEGEQGGDRAIHARYGNRMQAMTEKELRRLMEENSGKYVVYDGKIITPGSNKQLKNHTIVRIGDKMMGGGRKKGQKKQNKEETTSSSESDALQDMFMSLVKQDDDEVNSIFQTMTQLDDEMIQEAMNNMRQAFGENSKKFGMEKLSFEAVERLICENRNSAQQSIKAQQEKAMQKAERREEEVRRFKRDQKQIMIEKERQAREKQEQEAVTNDEQDRPAVQAQSIDERYCKKVENFTGEQPWRDWSFQFKATTRIVNEAAYHLIETAENEEKEINDALSLSEEQRSLSVGIFNILGTLVKGEPLQILHTSGSSGFEAWSKWRKWRFDLGDIMAKIARQSIKEIATTVNGYLKLIREIRRWILELHQSTRRTMGRTMQRTEENWIGGKGEAKIEEKRRTAEVEAEAKKRERIMKQIRRAEMENERSEERDNHNDNDNDAKKFMEEAKGSKTKADDFMTEETGGKAKAGNLTEAKGNKARTEEDSNRHEAAARNDPWTRGRVPICFGKRTPTRWKSGWSSAR